jgi:hypothetical protein
LISPVRSGEEPLRQHRAMQIATFVAAALFMENLDSTIIVTGSHRWRDPSAPVLSV